jgi:hypothetical protein
MTITLPLTLPGIIVGTVLAFARSLGIRRDHYLCFKHSWRNAHHSFGDVYPYSDAWR